jgi:hypothetical protein
VHRLAEKIYRRTAVCRTEEGVSVVSECEVLVLVVTADGKNPARNISERHKIVEKEGWKKKVKKE